MTPIRPGIRKLFRLDRWKREDASSEMRDEMELHIALRAEQLVKQGMSPGDAEREARRMFANNDDTLGSLHQSAIDRNKHMEMSERLGGIWQDTRYAARRLAREPLITVFILCILALGIGTNVAAFSIVDRVLLRGPQHVREPDRLVRLYSHVNQKAMGDRTTPWIPHTILDALQGRMGTIEAMGAYRVDNSLVGSGLNAETRRVSLMSSSMFGLLGVQPVRGRFYSAAEDLDAVAVVSESYWRTSMGGVSDVIGKSVTIEQVPHVIVGVAPVGFTGAEFRRVDMWIPIKRSNRNSQNMQIVARLKPGATVDGAMRELAQNRAQIEATLPKFAGWLRGATYLAAPISYNDTANVPFEAIMTRWLAAISAVILLASCANVANLLLARLARRRRELAVRIALGSGRGRVMRLLALEGLLLAVGASLLAFVVISLLEPVVKSALFPEGAWEFSMLDGRIVAAVAAFTLVTGLLVSVVPAIQSGRRNVSDALRSGTRTADSRSGLRSSLTVVQAMLSVVLLVGAGLFLRSMQRVDALDLGIDAERVVMPDLRFPRAALDAGEKFEDFMIRLRSQDEVRFRALAAAASRVPGVANAAFSVGVPFFDTYSAGVWVPGRDSIAPLAGGGPYASAISADYFKTIGTKILKGRAFTDADRDGSETVVVISETMARVLWPSEDPIDKCLVVNERNNPCTRVVGVAADTHRSGLKEEPSMQYYLPIGQHRGFSGSTLLIKPSGDVPENWPALREALLKADPMVQSIQIRLLSQGYDREMRPLQLGVTAFGLSAILALVVAMLGLYSIMSHAVAWRRHEIGVRLALGAQPRSIAALIVSRGTQLATAGIVLGLIVTFGARRWIEPLLFNTSATDPVVVTSVIVLLESIALLAGWLPAQRAVTVSPTEALRSE